MKKLKQKTRKQRAIRLNLDNTFDEIKIDREMGKLNDGQSKMIFTPAHVFVERKKPMFKNRRRIIIYPEGGTKPIKFKEVTIPDGKKAAELDDVVPFWTQAEAREFVHKETTDSLKKHKPMSWAQFIIILIPCIIILGVVLKIASQVGAL